MPAAAESRKKSSKNFVRTAITSMIRCGAKSESPDSVSGISPSSIFVKKSMPTARTSGSAYGSLISGSGARVAIARAPATMVAVAPTLDAKSQVSLSVRAIACLLFQRRVDVHQLAERLLLVGGRLKAVAHEQLGRCDARRLPAVRGEVGRCLSAVADVHQVHQVDLETMP